MNKKGWRHPVNILVFTIAATLTIIGYISGVVSVLGKSGVIDIPYMEAKSVNYTILLIFNSKKLIDIINSYSSRVRN